jgi:hypothetical protein
MMKRRLFVNERELRSLGGITLTTNRVIAHAKHGNAEASTSLQLDQIQWTRLDHGSRPELTAAAGVVGVLAVGLLLEGTLVLGTMLGAIASSMALINVLWRRTVVVIGGGSGRIRAWIDGDHERRRQARNFLDAIDHAAAGESNEAVEAIVALARRHLQGKDSFDAAHGR